VDGLGPESRGAVRRHGAQGAAERHHQRVRVAITGINLPGRAFCRPDGSSMDNVHVGVQVRQDPTGLVRADESEACWEVDVEVVRKDGVLDFRGPAVHGKRGDRFIYLTWGDVGPDNTFEMFRRAKLILDRVEPELIESAMETGCLRVVVDLTDGRGGPRCARVDPPALTWSAREA
jgi:Family of unknown function (DUF5990)